MYCPVLFINRNRSWIVSKLVERFPGHCPAVCRSFTSRPSDCRCKILACEVQACAESKVSIYFSPFSFQLFFRFSCLIFFSLAGHLVGFISVGKKVFRKALRWKERYVVSGTRFSWKFSDQCCNFFFSPFSPLFLTELCSFWYCLKDFSLCTSQWTKLSLTIRTDGVTSGRKNVDRHGRLRATHLQMD